MRSVEDLFEPGMTPEQRDAAVRQEYEHLNGAEHFRDHSVKLFVEGLLRRIILLGAAGDNPLPKTDNSMHNYELGRLARKNQLDPDAVRSARFANGLFYCVRVSEAEESKQYDFEFYDESAERVRPRIASRPLRKNYDGNVYLGVFPPKYPLDRNEIWEEPIPQLIMNAHRIIDKEASASWPNQYTPLEIRALRRKRHEKQVMPYAPNPNRNPSYRYIGINTELGEPYL